jgi:N-acetylmuramoyl-L-alanine amidase
MMRGDDVADLQRRLSQFGFYPGAIDAIYGEPTAAALSEFQRNVGVPPDGVLGRRTFEELERLGSRAGHGELVSSVFERHLPRHAAALRGALVVVGQEGGFAQGVAAVCRALLDAGAHPVDVHHPDASRLAAEANAVDASVYVGLQLDASSRAVKTNFYRGFRYESLASRQLAELIQADLPGLLGLEDAGTAGMALPILRETRMPAVLVEMGSPAVVVRHTNDIGQLLCRALASWMAREPVGSP